MKNVCSFKIISAVILAFVCMFSPGISAQDNTELTEYEALMLKTFLINEEARPAVRIAFWLNMNKQVKEMRATLPKLVHKNIALMGIKWDGLVTIGYTYFVNDDTVDVTHAKENLIRLLCNDAQTMLYLNTFDGEFHYTYFLYGDMSEIWYEFHFNSADCGVGI